MKDAVLSKKLDAMKKKLGMENSNHVNHSQLPSKILKVRTNIYNKDLFEYLHTTSSDYDPSLRDIYLNTKVFDDIPEEFTLLKTEHINQGYQITPINLPKLPFGAHLDYNDENKFKDKHMLDKDEENSPNSKRLQEIDRQLKTFSRKMDKKPVAKYASVQNKPHQAVQSFDTDAGKLICKKEKEIIDVYDREKQRYSKRKEKYPCLTKYNRVHNKFRDKKAIIKKAAERLCPISHLDSSSPVSRTFDLRFNRLLEKYS